MRASIAWCVIPVPVSPVVAYRSPWSERRLRSLVSPIRGFYGIRASSVGGVSWSFVRVFRRSLLPRSGLRSQWHLRGLVLDPSVSLLRSVSRSFSSLLRSVLRRVLGSVFSFDRVVASFGFWELGLLPLLPFSLGLSSSIPMPFVRSSRSRVCYGIVLRRSLESFGVFDPSSSPSGLRYLSFMSLHCVPSWASGSLGYDPALTFRISFCPVSWLLRSVLRRCSWFRSCLLFDLLLRSGLVGLSRGFYGMLLRRYSGSV